MQVTYDPKTKDITITIKAQTPRLSGSGHTMLVATETLKEAAEVEGHQVAVGVNVYYKPTE